ncbi:hypothetical protein [Cupriavidus necator]
MPDQITDKDASPAMGEQQQPQQVAQESHDTATSSPAASVPPPSVIDNAQSAPSNPEMGQLLNNVVNSPAGVRTPNTLPYPFDNFTDAFSQETPPEIREIPPKLHQVWVGGELSHKDVYSMWLSRQALPPAWGHFLYTDDPQQKSQDFLAKMNLMDPQIRDYRLSHDPSVSEGDRADIVHGYRPDADSEWSREATRAAQQFDAFNAHITQRWQDPAATTTNRKPDQVSLDLESLNQRSGVGARHELSVSNRYHLDSTTIQHERGRSIVYVDGKPIQFISLDHLIEAVRNSGILPPDVLLQLHGTIERQRNNFFATHQEASDIVRTLALLSGGGLYADADVVIHREPKIKVSTDKVRLYENNNNIMAATAGSTGVRDALSAMPDAWSRHEEGRRTQLHDPQAQEILKRDYKPDADNVSRVFPGINPLETFLTLAENNFSIRGIFNTRDMGRGHLSDSFSRVVSTTSRTGPGFWLSVKDLNGKPLLDRSVGEKTGWYGRVIQDNNGQLKLQVGIPGYDTTMAQSRSVSRFQDLRQRYEVSQHWAPIDPSIRSQWTLDKQGKYLQSTGERTKPKVR